MKPLIIENALPDTIFKPLQSLLLDTPGKVPFYFQIHTTYAKGEEIPEDDLCDYQWTHSIFHEAEGVVSSLWEPVKEVFEYIFKEYEFPEAQICRIKLNALNAHYTPITHAPHIDTTTSSGEHFTMVLYINDSSGDTVLYEEVGEIDLGQEPTEVLRVRPKANKLLAFNSFQNHSSSTPEDVKVRYILNAVFKVV